MKKVVLIVAFCLGVLSVFAQHLNVIDYFRLLPDSLRDFYTIGYKDGKWHVPCHGIPNCFLKPKVDLKNGFIEIVNDVEAQGEITEQFVLFSDLQGNRFMGISRKSVSAGSIATKFSFWLYKDKTWIDVTDNVLPRFSINYFLRPGHKFPQFLSDVFAIWYDLPQFGTVVEVKLDSVDVEDFIDGISRSQQDFEGKLKQYRVFRQNLRYVQFGLKWDKKYSRFVVE